MTLRTFKERVIQTGSFELIGIAFVSPLYAYFTGASMVHGFAMIAMLSVVIMIWCPIFNTIFDLIERDKTARLACKRPQSVRVLHATLHEVTAVMITCPLLMVVGGHSLGSALALNVGLTLTYTVYTFLFHIAYDRVRPIQPCPNKDEADQSEYLADEAAAA
ncbi:PACE efflux transporter [Ruegeria atlantica]|uniref:Putative membrane protein n=1 Tax=Ruegeria atlantica TaxID=81569 RepID=A0A0P1ESL0_9RHOB|nr:PACE efflux transporter [Ruegeria atlantica]CUH45039.1 putative membrane protein [Ruegeria atlantica]